MTPSAAVGHGDDVSFRQRSASALDAVGPDTVANIEHQDAALGKIEGLRVAADTLHRARAIGARA